MAKSPLTKEQWDKQGITVPSNPQTPEEKVALVESLPATVKQIHVCDASGCSVWRAPTKILDTDTIVFRKSNSMPNLRLAKPKVEPEEDEIQERVRKREVFTDVDDLVRTAKHSLDPDDINRQTLIRMTEVASSLKFERMQAELEGRDTVKMLQQEMRALKIVSDVSSKQVDQRLKKQEIDLGSLAFRNIVVKMLETFHGTMVRAGHTPEQASAIITKMSKELDTEEWQSSMSKAIAGD